MKILLVSTLYPPHIIGGAEKAAALLAEGLVRRGHRVVVVTLHPEPDEIVEDRNGVRVYRLPIDNFYWPFGQKNKPHALLRLAWHIREMWNFKAGRRVGEILDAELPDVVNTHNVCGFSLAAWREIKRRRLRLVHTIHDYYLLCSRSTLFRDGRNCENQCLDCKLLTLVRKHSSRLPDVAVSVSQHTLHQHNRRGFFEGVAGTVIYNVQQQAAKSPTMAFRGNPSSQDLRFGFIGKIEEAKGIETLLAATKRLHQWNWKLRIAGQGLDSYVHNLRERFPDPRIEWLGFTDAGEFYSSVDVVVIPSLWAEPLPYVCVESLHAGKALICASSGGISEIAELSEVVEFFPAGSEEALAERMSQALMSPQRWLECTAPVASKLKVFREEQVVEKYLREYVGHDNA